MRILCVNHLMDPISGGGTAERTFQLSLALSKAGLECAVLTLDIGIDTLRGRDQGGTKIIALPCLFRRFFVPRFSWRKLKQEVAAADIIHLMGHWTLLNALVFFAARSVRRPYVVCPAGALPIIGRSSLLKRLYNRCVGRRIICGASGHIAITRDESEQFSNYGIDPANVIVIPNGVSPHSPAGRACLDFLAQHGLGERKFMLFLGRLAYIKGPDLLLDAFAGVAQKRHDIDLVYAGPDGGMLSALREQVARRGIAARVRFIGYVGGDDKACVLETCELLVIPSRKEAMSFVALEAGACGKPVLLTDQCGFDDVQRIGGGQVASATPEALERGLMEMIANPSELVLMGARLKEYVSKNFTWEQAVAKHLSLFRTIVGSA